MKCDNMWSVESIPLEQELRRPAACCDAGVSFGE